MRASSATYGRMSRAPSAQLSPTLNGLRVRDGHPEGVDRLPGQRAAAAIGDRRGDHQRQAHARLLEHLLDRHDARLGVRACRRSSRSSSRSAPPSMSPRICVLNASRSSSKVTLRKAGLLTSGEMDRIRFVGSHRAGDEARTVGRPRGPLVGGLPRQPRGGDVQLVDDRLEPVVGLRDGLAAEAVGLDDVGARLEILAVDAAG